MPRTIQIPPTVAVLIQFDYDTLGLVTIPQDIPLEIVIDILRLALSEAEARAKGVIDESQPDASQSDRIANREPEGSTVERPDGDALHPGTDPH